MEARLSVVIPAGDDSRQGNLQALLQDISRQTLVSAEVEIVKGVSPNGLARNRGMEKTSAPFLIFLDDDVRLGAPDVFQRLVEALQADATLGMVGTAQQLPPDSTPFQRACAGQVPRSESSVVAELTESDMVTTQCCALRREVLDQVGRFHPKIRRGVDPELRHRLRQNGFRIAVVPHAWHYHPMPASLAELLRQAFRNGAASAFAQRYFPETVLVGPEGHVGEFQATLPLWRRVVRNLLGILGSVVTARWYGLLFRLAYAAGYAWQQLLPVKGTRTVRE